MAWLGYFSNNFPTTLCRGVKRKMSLSWFEPMSVELHRDLGPSKDAQPTELQRRGKILKLKINFCDFLGTKQVETAFDRKWNDPSFFGLKMISIKILNRFPPTLCSAFTKNMKHFHYQITWLKLKIRINSNHNSTFVPQGSHRRRTLELGS